MYPCESIVRMTELSQGPGENFTCHEDSLSLPDQNHKKKNKHTAQSRLASNVSQEKEEPSFPLICSCTDLFLIEMKFPVKKNIQIF